MKSRKPTLCAMLCGVILTLSGCQTTIPTSGIELAPAVVEAVGHASFCQIAKPISYSRRDTAQTREEITEHNCVGHKLCGWKVGAKTCPDSL